MVGEDLIRAAAKALGKHEHALSLEPVSGGDICDAYRVDAGDRYFMKVHSCRSLLESEADGLQAIASVNAAPRVPEVIALVHGEHGSALLLEYIPPGSRHPVSLRDLGRALAFMHREGQSQRFGFHRDNMIGQTPQENTWCASWVEFFSRYRIGALTDLAQSRGLLKGEDLRILQRLCSRLPELLEEPNQGSLLHGDLWGGNYLVSDAGEGVLIDPAVYYGHREADLAMTELFGGFPREFYEGYNEAYPLDDGYSQRRDIYNIYHLLNHLCMFGGGYLSSVTASARRYV